MAHEREPGWYDLAETIPENLREARPVEAAKQEQWLLRPCDACGDTYRVWGTQVELLPFCAGTRCKRDRPPNVAAISRAGRGGRPGRSG